MTLSTAADFKSQLLALSPTTDPASGAAAFVGALAGFMNQTQAGSTGSPGIFTFNNAVMIPLMLAMLPVPDNSWIPIFVTNWTTAVTASIITPGTVMNPIWIGSASLDSNTLPTAAATIITIPAATAALSAGLVSVPTASDKTLQFATSIRDATLAFTFLCIGLAAPPALTPIPIPISAQ